MNHLLRQWSYQKAFVHQAGFHVQGNKVPSRHCPFGRQLGQHEQRYIHAIKKSKYLYENFVWSLAFLWFQDAVKHLVLQLCDSLV